MNLIQFNQAHSAFRPFSGESQNRQALQSRKTRPVVSMTVGLMNFYQGVNKNLFESRIEQANGRLQAYRERFTFHKERYKHYEDALKSIPGSRSGLLTQDQMEKIEKYQQSMQRHQTSMKSLKSKIALYKKRVSDNQRSLQEYCPNASQKENCPPTAARENHDPSPAQSLGESSPRADQVSTRPFRKNNPEALRDAKERLVMLNLKHRREKYDKLRQNHVERNQENAYSPPSFCQNTLVLRTGMPGSGKGPRLPPLALTPFETLHKT